MRKMTKYYYSSKLSESWKSKSEEEIDAMNALMNNITLMWNLILLNSKMNW